MNAKDEDEADATSRSVTLPAEKPSSVWTRRLIILAFWAVVVCLGLPHWTWTTSIHRSALPLGSMNAWADGQACQLRYPLHIKLNCPELNAEQAHSLAKSVQGRLAAKESLRSYIFSVSPESVQTNATASDLTVLLDIDPRAESPLANLLRWGSRLSVRHALASNGNVDELVTFIADEVAKVYEDESASLWHLVKTTPFAQGLQPVITSPGKTADLDRRTTRAFKYAPAYHVTFSLFAQGASPSAWQINEALQEYVQPLLAQLSPISNFSVDTQVQLFATFSPSIAGPVLDEAKKQWTLRNSDLTGFVNAAEWPLSPSIGEGPTVNFVLYVPAPDKRPLLIEESGGSSWIIPQWGGVQIHNAASTEPDTLTMADLEPDMLVFADQLASLLAVPREPSNLSLRISALTRERATGLILSASSTLGALSRLTLKLQSIAIPDTVAKAVDQTLQHLDQACSDLRRGRYQNALEHARTADTEVEKAFFEPSMVGQVYFPEEHKVAVYVPLLGPMAVPLIMSGIKELKKLRGKKQKAA